MVDTCNHWTNRLWVRIGFLAFTSKMVGTHRVLKRERAGTSTDAGQAFSAAKAQKFPLPLALSVQFVGKDTPRIWLSFSCGRHAFRWVQQAGRENRSLGILISFWTNYPRGTFASFVAWTNQALSWVSKASSSQPSPHVSNRLSIPTLVSFLAIKTNCLRNLITLHAPDLV